ncbi:MAG: cation acetate symporter [Planctomycetaceae bacterium]|nr:cation acetate symporter [Planctomycetaceae bacterium]
MIYEPSYTAVIIFLAFVGLTMGLSFYLGGKAKSSAGYFAAHGQIPWFINGVAFAGDYLSAASFLGICGMIAFYGYDGFLYSIGFLAGWIVALFVVAEPLKRLGKFTFADALNAKFQSPGITLVIGISTLIVSVFYLIPQMVGAGALITPLLGYSHWVGVLIVGATVIVIVVTAGMVSTTWVQFLKGSLLVLFSAILTIMILNKGFTVTPESADAVDRPRTLGPFAIDDVMPQGEGGLGNAIIDLPEMDGGSWGYDSPASVSIPPYIIASSGVWSVQTDAGNVWLRECQTVEDIEEPGKGKSSKDPERVYEAGAQLVNGYLKGEEYGDPTASYENGRPRRQLFPVGQVSKLPEGKTETGALGPMEFFRTLSESEVILWGKAKHSILGMEGVNVYVPKVTAGSQVLRPGENPKFAGIRSTDFTKKLNFVSLMLALFCGTASLPHILIRYYTVKDQAAARKSTIVGIGAIGFFYVLTLYLGLGAMTSGAMDVTNTNMSAPLLAKSMSPLLFAIISAIAFTTVLGTVSGLILAAAGAVVHDIMKNYMHIKLTDSESVRVAKITSVIVGAAAIVLGILFKELNVGALVGWAFSIAASANLPSLIMLLFWKRTTREGIISGVVVGMVTSLAWILLSGPTLDGVFGFKGHAGYVPFSEPGIVTIPLGFLTVIGVSLMTPPHVESATEPAADK